jgi:hypothetical protein
MTLWGLAILVHALVLSVALLDSASLFILAPLGVLLLINLVVLGVASFVGEQATTPRRARRKRRRVAPATEDTPQPAH